jgi:NADPH2 dehydrogenase
VYTNRIDSGMSNVPGIWSPPQVAAWRKVTDAVHAKGCYIYCQLWNLGRKADPAILAREEGGPYPVLSASDVPNTPGGHKPEPLTKDGIQTIIKDYVTAARNSIDAGFDGVEIHGANGYLIDQFLSPDVNHRTDEYGGSVENRSRFGIEVTSAIIKAIGDSAKVGIRLSPWTDQGFPLDGPGDRIPQFTHIISQLKTLNLAYLHLVESRISGDVGNGVYDPSQSRNDPLIREWGTEQPIMLAGGFTPETAAQIAEQYAQYKVLIAFGRYYISTPDLPFRIRKGLELNPYDRKTFYLKKSPVGYTDYPFHPQYTSSIRAKA